MVLGRNYQRFEEIECRSFHSKSCEEISARECMHAHWHLGIQRSCPFYPLPGLTCNTDCTQTYSPLLMNTVELHLTIFGDALQDIA